MNEKTIKQPNLFDYATSELSQDAFICWLLSWADPKYETELHNCAVELIKVFFKKKSKECPSIKTINTKPQYKKIDILCIINDKYPILIEDKTNTKNHSNQLERYLSIVKKDYKEENIIPIYFKTGFQLKYKDVEEAGFSVFNRKDFLAVLGKYKDKITNNIFIDYYNYLDNIEQKCLDYKETNISEWSKCKYQYQWQGFIAELYAHKELKGDGRYVNNPSGSFWGYWWLWDAEKPYLQIEKSKLRIKINASKCDNKVEVRREWHDHIKESKLSEQEFKFKNPSRRVWSSNGTMTLFENKDFRIVKPNTEIIDMEKTIDKLKNITEIFKQTINSKN